MQHRLQCSVPPKTGRLSSLDRIGWLTPSLRNIWVLLTPVKSWPQKNSSRTKKMHPMIAIWKLQSSWRIHQRERLRGAFYRTRNLLVPEGRREELKNQHPILNSQVMKNRRITWQTTESSKLMTRLMIDHRWLVIWMALLRNTAKTKCLLNWISATNRFVSLTLITQAGIKSRITSKTGNKFYSGINSSLKNKTSWIIRSSIERQTIPLLKWTRPMSHRTHFLAIS